MKGSLLLPLLLVGLVGELASGAEQKEHDSPHSTKDGKRNDAHDAEAMLGSEKSAKEFSKLSPEDAKKKLTEIFNKMDTNKDKFVSKEELTQWIVKSFIVLDYEEAQNEISQYDMDNDGKVSWKECHDRLVGDNNDTTSDGYLDMIKEEKNKFTAADVDHDGILTMVEFTAFLYPYDFEHMHDVELDMTMLAIDMDKDGKISLKEFVKGGVDEDDEENRGIFYKYDVDKDDALSREELRPWAIPDNVEESVKEAEQLISQTDTNDDKKLSLEEILEKASAWGASSVTRYNLGDHDEL